MGASERWYNISWGDAVVAGELRWGCCTGGCGRFGALSCFFENFLLGLSLASENLFSLLSSAKPAALLLRLKGAKACAAEKIWAQLIRAAQTHSIRRGRRLGLRRPPIPNLGLTPPAYLVPRDPVAALQRRSGRTCRRSRRRAWRRRRPARLYPSESGRCATWPVRGVHFARAWGMARGVKWDLGDGQQQLLPATRACSVGGRRQGHCRNGVLLLGRTPGVMWDLSPVLPKSERRQQCSW